MSEPLDKKQSVRFFLDFVNSVGIIEIAEPTSFDAANFVLMQEDGRYARDVFFADVDMVFSPSIDYRGLTHQFDRIITEFKNNGFEAEVKFIMRIDDVDFVIGELDFKDCITDQITKFSCKIIQDTKQATLKRREKVAVDLFNDVSLDVGGIKPLVPVDILLQATPQRNISQWSESSILSDSMTLDIDYVISFTPVIEKSGINNTLSPQVEFFSDADFVKERFKYIEAADTMIDIGLEMTNFTYDLTGADTADLFVAWGVDFASSVSLNFSLPLTADDFSKSIILSDLDKGDTMWIWIAVNNGVGTTDFTMTSGTIEITSTALAISSTVKGVRFIDAFKQVANSIAEMSVISPRFDVGGEYYDQYIFNAVMLRQLEDEPFNLSFEQLLDQLPEVNGDYQILDNDNVFLGIYEDFHVNTKIGEFLTIPNETFKITFNERYAVNKFNLKFKKYEKEEDEDNSRDGLNTEIETLLPNLHVENTKQVNIEFIRGAPLIEKIRKDAIKVTDTTATKDDDDIIIIDVIEKSLSFTEAMSVNQVQTGDLGESLQLVNDNSFNWELLGMTLLDPIEITGSNAGLWRVFEISPNVLRLIVINNPDPIVIGVETIDFSYDVTSTNLTQRLGDGFEDLGETFFTNIKFSNKRLLLNYWGGYINACCAFRQGGTILTTKYIHNKNYQSRLLGDPALIIEDAAIVVAGLPQALVTPYLIETDVICDFTTFWQLTLDIKNIRGYITVSDNEGNTKDLFSKGLSLEWAKNILSITGEEKAEIIIKDEKPKEPTTETYVFEDDINFEFDTGVDYVFNN